MMAVVIFISMIALIILIDTFKYQLEKYIPGIKFIFDNLYEALKDFSDDGYQYDQTLSDSSNWVYVRD